MDLERDGRRCAVCGLLVIPRKDGRLRSHVGRDGAICSGGAGRQRRRSKRATTEPWKPLQGGSPGNGNRS